MSYVDRADQRRADLAYYYRNRDRILKLRKARRQAAALIAAGELAAKMIEIKLTNGRTILVPSVPQSESGSYDAIKKNKWRAVDFMGRDRRFSVIAACSSCGKFGLNRRRYGWIGIVKTPPRTIEWRLAGAEIAHKRGDLEFCCEQCAEHPVCVVAFCDVCGVCGPPKTVCDRSDVYMWNRTDRLDYTTRSKDSLCVKCWNKARAIYRRYWEAEENRLQINRLLKEISNERRARKNRNDGPASGLPRDDDGRREERRP